MIGSLFGHLYKLASSEADLGRRIHEREFNKNVLSREIRKEWEQHAREAWNQCLDRLIGGNACPLTGTIELP